MDNRDSLYGRRWKKARRIYLSTNPTCRYCQQLGKLTEATVVDHITPHRGDAELFWDESNWQPLCQPCHDSVKQRQEKTGPLVGNDTNGDPLDPAHHWN